jgi:hypothetical protein
VVSVLGVACWRGRVGVGSCGRDHVLSAEGTRREMPRHDQVDCGWISWVSVVAVSRAYKV